MSRAYRAFQHKEAVFRICCDRFESVAGEIVRQRGILEDYIRSNPRFGPSLTPLDVTAGAPEVVRRMAGAATRAGVGPMAAVAGAMAQLAAEAGLAAGAREAIVENGGDIYLQRIESPVVVGLHAGTDSLGDRLAFSVKASETPLAICSSSGKMGHSYSMGKCDLATVTARDAALADAAATRAANMVRVGDDVDLALSEIVSIHGVEGVLIVMDDRVGLAGRLPEMIQNAT